MDNTAPRFRRSNVSSINGDTNDVLESMRDHTSRIDYHFNTIKIDYDTIKLRNEHQKELFIDRVYNELIVTTTKYKKVLQKYRKAKKVAKKNFERYQE